MVWFIIIPLYLVVLLWYVLGFVRAGQTGRGLALGLGFTLLLGGAYFVDLTPPLNYDWRLALGTLTIIGGGAMPWLIRE
jgi:hypothetical protein